MHKSDLPLRARFAYPAGIHVRPQPDSVEGQLHLVDVPQGVRGDHWSSVASNLPVRNQVIGLVHFDPQAALITFSFGDVADQVAFEAANFNTDEPFLLKSERGGVWRMAFEERIQNTALPGTGPFSIEATYRVVALETLSEPLPEEP